MRGVTPPLPIVPLWPSAYLITGESFSFYLWHMTVKSFLCVFSPLLTLKPTDGFL